MTDIYCDEKALSKFKMGTPVKTKDKMKGVSFVKKYGHVVGFALNGFNEVILKVQWHDGIISDISNENVEIMGE